MTALVASCGGGDGGPIPVTEPPPPPLQIESGTFDVTAAVTFNGCNSARLFDGTYDVQIEDSGFTMGDWIGSWSATAASLTARGESPHSVQTTRDCTMRSWTEVDVTFTSGDGFTGHITYRYRVVGMCTCCDNCQSSWYIRGVRTTP